MRFMNEWDFEDGQTGTVTVEMYVARLSRTWDTVNVEIPATTLAHEVESVATAALYKLLAGQDDVAFTGVYHLPSDE